jgi:hypothetical protein
MTEEVRRVPNPDIPPGHEIKNIARLATRTKISCECGATWTVANDAYDRGTTYVEDHWHYAKKKPTQVD